MQSKATTVAGYLAELPLDRRLAIEAVREVILKNLDKKGGLEEGMASGMIAYYVPHSVYPDGYHCDPKQPLPYAGLASQKQHMSLHLMGLYCGRDGGPDHEFLRWFIGAWAKSGKKLDMGKACIRFKKLEDLPLDVIGEAFGRVPAKMYIAHYESSIRVMNKAAATRAEKKKAGATGRGVKKASGKKVAKKTGKKKAARA
jgi:hypothetical protein